jgi:PilZ domain-containing protein
MIVNIYELRRREPRVTLRTRAVIVGDAKRGRGLRQEAVTIDVSLHGASVIVADEIAVGSYIGYEAIGYYFRTRARVCSCKRDFNNGCVILGLEYSDRANPLVIWSAPEDERGQGESESAYVVVLPDKP